MKALKACKKLDVPLITHFHGFDASVREVIDQYRESYLHLFEYCAAIIVVSRRMYRDLRDLGCPENKLIYSPCGFSSFQPNEISIGTKQPKRLVATGRFVGKKAPHLTLLMFAKVLEQYPNTRLIMIGDGPLFPVCVDLVKSLKIEKFVTLAGALPHEKTLNLVKNSDVFVQHSIVDHSGDSEGTPVSILEAMGAGRPVVSTRHAGIPDVIVHEQSGLLSEERDISQMSEHVIQLLKDDERSHQLGTNARNRALSYYTMEKSINRLQLVIDAASRLQNMTDVKAKIESSLPTASDRQE